MVSNYSILFEEHEQLLCCRARCSKIVISVSTTDCYRLPACVGIFTNNNKFVMQRLTYNYLLELEQSTTIRTV